MRFLISEKLGPHKYKTPEGYLVCVDAILSRTGTQEYRRCELFGDACDDPDKIITVDRKADEVFSDKTMASFENKAICIEHPNANVNVENHNDLSVGFVRDIHQGEDNGTPVMMGTLVITDKEAVEAVESGEYKELSCGYDCDIVDEHSPQQRNIRGNHVALCKQGRAGIARIVDSTKYIDDAYTDFEYGYRDGKAGTYDKWYRYNRKDEGKEYDMGIQKAKGEGYEIKNYIKGTGDSMKDELLTDMDVNELMKYYTGKNTKYGTNIFKINGKYTINPNVSSKRYNTIAELEADEEKYAAKMRKGYAPNDPNQFGDSEDFQAGDIIEGDDRFAGNGPENTYRVLERVGKGKYRVEPVSPSAVKFAKGKKVMVIKVPEEAYKLKDSTADSALRDGTDDAIINDALDFAGFVAKNKEISLIRKYVNGWLVDISPNDVSRITHMAFRKGIDIVKSRKFPGKYVLRGWDGSNEYYIDSIEDATGKWYRVAYYTIVRSSTDNYEMFVRAESYSDAKAKAAKAAKRIHRGEKICPTFDMHVSEVSEQEAKRQNPSIVFDSIQTQDTFTVEYVKDNVTHIVEVEAKTITDAVIKAKTLFR